MSNTATPQPVEVENPPPGLHVVMLVESLHGGGAELFTVGLGKALAAGGHRVVVCASRGVGGNTRPIAHESGVDVLMLGRTRMVSPLAWLRLIRYLRRERVDVLNAHMFGSNVWAPILGRLGGVPVVVATEHSWTYSGNRLRMLLDRFWVSRGSDAFVAVSPEDARRMVEIEKVSPSKVRTIATGLLRDPADIERADPTVRAELGLSKDTPIVGTVANIRHMKAIDVLVDAFSQVLGSCPQAHLVVAGDGPLRPDVEAQIARLGIGDNVHLLGARKDVPQVLASCDVFVLASDSEGSPIAVIEAMTAGRAIVATHVGGVPAILDHGGSGILVAPRQPVEMAEAIVSMLVDPARRRALGDAAAARARAEYRIERIAERWSNLFRELLMTRRGRRRTPNR